MGELLLPVVAFVLKEQVRKGNTNNVVVVAFSLLRQQPKSNNRIGGTQPAPPARRGR